MNQAELKRCAEYDPDTGHFFWVVTGGRKVAGRRAGCLPKGSNRRVISINKEIRTEYQLAYLYMIASFPPKGKIIHRDRNTANNSWANIKPSSKLKVNRKSVMDGISYMPNNEKWRVFHLVNGIRKHIGSYSSKDAAINAKRKAENKYSYE